MNTVVDNSRLKDSAIHEHETMCLSARDSEAFFEALSKPVRFNDKLAAALAEHDQRVDSV